MLDVPLIIPIYYLFIILYHFGGGGGELGWGEVSVGVFKFKPFFHAGLLISMRISLFLFQKCFTMTVFCVTCFIWLIFFSFFNAHIYIYNLHYIG